jgi:hypothetical protein
MENTIVEIVADCGAGSATNYMTRMSDFELLKMCADFGAVTLKWRQKFIGLLPEVNRRKLYEKRKCGSIYEFAAKVGGVSNDLVDQAIRLERKLQDKPALLKAFLEGSVSMSKLERVCPIATPENDDNLLGMAKELPRKALEVCVRDFKNLQLQNAAVGGGNGAGCGVGKIGNGLFEPLVDSKVLPGQRISTLNCELANEVVEELNRLDEQGQDINEILIELLEYRKQKIEDEKQEISEDVAEAGPAETRYIQKRIRNVLEEEYGKKCSAPGCKKPSMEIHHTLPFSLTRRHDPIFMAPLCREHHQIAHLVNLKYAEKLKR